MKGVCSKHTSGSFHISEDQQKEKMIVYDNISIDMQDHSQKHHQIVIVYSDSSNTFSLESLDEQNDRGDEKEEKCIYTASSPFYQNLEKFQSQVNLHALFQEKKMDDDDSADKEENCIYTASSPLYQNLEKFQSQVNLQALVASTKLKKMHDDSSKNFNEQVSSSKITRLGTNISVPSLTPTDSLSCSEINTSISLPDADYDQGTPNPFYLRDNAYIFLDYDDWELIDILQSMPL